MRSRPQLSRRVPFVLLGSLVVTGYFAYHAVNGTHGLLARYRLVERSAAIDREIAGLEAGRRRLKHDVVLLGSEPPHRDVTEEHARAILGFVNAGDLIVLDRAARVEVGALAQAPTRVEVGALAQAPTRGAATR